jgi:adenosylcobinamide kinase/adenosylcobinamide-phosphate guanylyltransferase
VRASSAPCPGLERGLVSNEVRSGVVRPYAMGRRYRDVLGEMNQHIAAVADSVVLMVAGLQLTLRDSLGHHEVLQ